MLISSFLGLGCRVLLARRRLGFYKWFTTLLLLLVLFVLATSGIEFQQGMDELRVLFKTGGSTTTFPIVLVFILSSNLLGAIVGGFLEYLGMITGTKALF